ncbi:unnamed protein product [Cylicocyclus nassatus]|uniref:S phase cyclin A-associated protein in the endoplasmic reticulum N-terminal domain-containing protein n=1 Tax=Cylicocyclus nassatus TaxID=53992 RepID=A0AA36M158_CYLNA|nr:unnamed protein product [Cylicocyclus nassatus]
MQDSSEVSGNPAALVVKSSKRKRAKRKRGQQWAYYVESFKRTVDCLYEICRSDHNINGCKEAIIYLENSKRDFESLINTIKVETTWDESSRPQAVAWEIRKSTRSPVDVPLDTLPPLLLKDTPNNSQDGDDEDLKEAIRLSLDDEWQVVLPRRRRSTSSSSEVITHPDPVSTTPSPQQQPEVEPPRPNVYDRLSAPRRTNSPSVINAAAASSRPVLRSSLVSQQARLTCPRSAMDLPQTKASMAKMAYSRQLLWERNQSLLAEKLRAKQRMDRVDRQRRRTGPTRCGIHFADRPSAQNAANSFCQRRQGNSAPVSERNPSVDRSLQSINEVAEGDEMETVPADPTPTDPSKDNVRFSSTRSEPAFNEVSSLLGLDDDVEWKEMTEEEESLALEEHSLNLEIEHEESFSIDVELERQVAAEAEALEKFELSQKTAFPNKDKSSSLGANSGQAADPDQSREDVRRRHVLTWSEVVGNREFSAYREPGTVAERHEKMSSPSRRRCEKDDADFSSRHAEKLRRATELREQLQAEKTARLRELARRVEEVREKRQKVIERKRQLLESRMERAQENREKNITEIIRRAKDDEQKVLEVQFINSLQGGNMLLDLRMRDAGVEERKQTLAEERAKRMEEKAAKEHAAEERRKQAEMERIARLQELAERKEARHAQIAAQKNEQERLRNERRKQQQEKLSELRLADAEENESLRKRIQEKIESSSRRHEQTLEEVRVRAQEFSSPRPPSGCRWMWSFVDCCHWPSDLAGITFTCSNCTSEMRTELNAVAHVMSEKHLSKTKLDLLQLSTDDLEREFCALNQSTSVETVVENQEDEAAFRKKRAKVKQRLAVRNKKVAELNETPPSPGRHPKCLRDLMNVTAKCQKPGRLDDTTLQVLDRSLSEVSREAQSQEWYAANVKSCNDSTLLCDLVNLMMKWTTTGASIRLLRKLAALICRFCSAPSFCRSILFTHVIVDLIDNIIVLLKSECDSDHSVCLLDVLLAAIGCARSSATEWKVFKVDEHELEVRISMLSSYLLSCRLPSVLDTIVTPAMSQELFIKLNTLHSVFADVVSEDTTAIASAFCGCVLKVAVSAVRSQSSPLEEHKADNSNAELYTEAAISLSERLSREDSCRKVLLDSAERSLRLLLLLGHVIRSTEKEAASNASSTSGMSKLAPSALELISRYASFTLSHQISCVLGGHRSLLSVTASLPVFYLTRLSLKVLFFSAVISMTYGNRSAVQLLLEELSEKHVLRFIKEIQEGHFKNVKVFEKVIAKSDFESLLRFYQTAAE